MTGAKEVFSALFRLMKSKGLLTKEEYTKLEESMQHREIDTFLEVVESICKEGE